MAELNQRTLRLIEQYKAWYDSLNMSPETSTIKVDEVASRVAAFYEKIRGIVEWKEEHLLRKGAIERVLRRKLFLHEEGGEFAEDLILHLIRGGHFPNDKIPEEKIEEVQKVLNKYIFILAHAPAFEEGKKKERTDLLRWLAGVGACEIEAILDPPAKEEAIISHMEEIMRQRIRVGEGVVSSGNLEEEEIRDQIAIAVRRALFNLDNTIITFHLLRRKYQWTELPESMLPKIAQNISFLREETQKALSHPLSEKFYQVCENYDTPFLILSDIIEKNPKEAQAILADKEQLEEEIDKAYHERYEKLKKRLGRAAIYATLSIFITKVALALTIEIPIEKAFIEINYLALGVNILVPPFLMLMLIKTVRKPDEENLHRVRMEVAKLIFSRDREDTYTIRVPKKRKFLSRFIIKAFYLFSYVISFGAIIFVLRFFLNFEWLSIAIFLMFISLIAFAGVRLRQRARELIVKKEKESLSESFVDFFTLPIVLAGKKLTREFEKRNAFVVVFNSLIDLPFHTFIEFLEQWRNFLKEKKDEIH